MDNIPQLGTAADLEFRAARIADPGIGTLIDIFPRCYLRLHRPQDEAHSSMRTQRND